MMMDARERARRQQVAETKRRRRKFEEQAKARALAEEEAAKRLLKERKARREAATAAIHAPSDPSPSRDGVPRKVRNVFGAAGAFGRRAPPRKDRKDASGDEPPSTAFGSRVRPSRPRGWSERGGDDLDGSPARDDDARRFRRRPDEDDGGDASSAATSGDENEHRRGSNDEGKVPSSAANHLRDFLRDRRIVRGRSDFLRAGDEGEGSAGGGRSRRSSRPGSAPWRQLKADAAADLGVILGELGDASNARARPDPDPDSDSRAPRTDSARMSGGGEGGEGEAAAAKKAAASGRRGSRRFVDAATARPRGGALPNLGAVSFSPGAARESDQSAWARANAETAADRSMGSSRDDSTAADRSRGSSRDGSPAARVSLALADDDSARAASPSTAAEDDDAVTTRDSLEEDQFMAERPTSAAKVWREGDDSEDDSEEESEEESQTLAQARAAMAAAERTASPAPDPAPPAARPGSTRPTNLFRDSLADMPGPPGLGMSARVAEVVSSVNGVLDSMDTFRAIEREVRERDEAAAIVPERRASEPPAARDPPTRMEMETDDTGIVSEYAMLPPPPHAEAAAPDRSSAAPSVPAPSATARLRAAAPPPANAASAREITPAEEVAALPEIPGAREEEAAVVARGEAGGGGSSAAPVRDDAGASAAEGVAPGAPAFSAVSAAAPSWPSAARTPPPPPPPPARAAPPASAAPPPRGYASRLEPSPDPPRRGVGAKGARGTPGSRGSTPGSSDRAKSRRVAERELKLEGSYAAVADEAESRRRRERRRLTALEAETRAARAEESAAREARRRREALHRRTPQNPPGAFSVFAPPRDADPRGYDFQTPPPQRAPRHHLAAPYEGAGYGDPEYDHHHPEYDDDHPEYAHHPEYDAYARAPPRSTTPRAVLGPRRVSPNGLGGRRAAPPAPSGVPRVRFADSPEARAARELLRGGGRAPPRRERFVPRMRSAGGGAAPTSVSAEEAKLLRSLRRLDAHCVDPGGAHRTEPGDQCAHDAIHTRRSTVDGLLDRPLESRRSAEEARLLASLARLDGALQSPGAGYGGALVDPPEPEAGFEGFEPRTAGPGPVVVFPTGRQPTSARPRREPVRPAQRRWRPPDRDRGPVRDEWGAPPKPIDTRNRVNKGGGGMKQRPGAIPPFRAPPVPTPSRAEPTMMPPLGKATSAGRGQRHLRDSGGVISGGPRGEFRRVTDYF